MTLRWSVETKNAVLRLKIIDEIFSYMRIKPNKLHLEDIADILDKEVLKI